LASGGFGIVYLAEDRKTHQKYAVKAIQQGKLKDYKTFVNEVKILRALVSNLGLYSDLNRITPISSSSMRCGSGRRFASWC